MVGVVMLSVIITSVTFFIVMLSAVILNAIMFSVMVPGCCFTNRHTVSFMLNNVF
jgi:hypothetical protein